MEKILGYFSAGDGPFYFAETIKKLGWLPVLWRADEGFGANHGFRLWYDYTLQLVIKILSSAGFTWWWTDKFLWGGAIAVAVYGAYILGKHFLKKPYAYLIPFVYVANTYFLLLFSGGQLGVAWGYALTPAVLAGFIGNAGWAKRGLLFALLCLVDLRLAYLAAGAIIFWSLVFGKKKFSFIIPFLVAAGINSFWIVPGILAGGSAAGLDNELTNPGMLRFLSFADFPHALALLHPNWPENLFGKIYFLQPEFLVLPILAFSALFVINDKRLKMNEQPLIVHHLSFIRYFAFLALIGSFLAKGVTEPFGFIYQWAFTHIPGFVMFRDPTKFYVYIALGYSVLIPFALERIQGMINDKRVKINDKTKIIGSFIIHHLSFIVFAMFWLFTIRAVFLGQVKGNFRPMQIPAVYVQLKNLLAADPAPSRTLWIPQREKFAYASDVHPLLYSDQLFPGASVSAVITLTQTPGFMAVLTKAGVKYVVVPEDLEQRLYLNDYRFDGGQRRTLIDALAKTPLVQNTSFGSVAVFENTQFTFTSEIPASVARQQQLTNTGLVISGIILIAAICKACLW